MLIPLILNNHGSDNECVRITSFLKKAGRRSKKMITLRLFNEKIIIKRPKLSVISIRIFCKENIDVLEITSLNQ
jgi:hypothetical protein